MALTVTTLVEFASAQPPEPLTVYVIVAVPTATVVITPLVAFTVATLVLDDAQGVLAFGVPLPVNVIV